MTCAPITGDRRDIPSAQRSYGMQREAKDGAATFGADSRRRPTVTRYDEPRLSTHVPGRRETAYNAAPLTRQGTCSAAIRHPL